MDIEKALAEKYLITLLYFSSISYCPVHIIETKLSEYGALSFFIFEKDSFFCYIAEFDDTVIVSFRGIPSATIKNLAIVFSSWKVTFFGTKTHAGFTAGLHKLGAPLLLKLREICVKKRVIYTGHSMGAALALLLSVVYKPDEICTFGSPKVGTRVLAEFLRDIKVTRVYHEIDVVTLLPPSFLGFTHVGSCIKLPRKKRFRFDVFYFHKVTTYLWGLKNLRSTRRHTAGLDI